ncbi:50S ribosomal protein L11 methyltransferase [Virgibacillus sp. 179-BFC.A HS]|uniref:Ribosomal protein L11 methyltransferase n=1 Tax=Tigheibacillus jepli TaxID=3035914 RepID=A0ABU5CGS0_9BACI|nr:50S ribosomal protein L11 methyltransferase [Virgibacillus sp. 179-BFC.A HS]MDY0405527.1 50S ribosomal protein L11 methyltransferase [Virgibacillus sp. 179-BFC.A HS]
MKWTQVCIRTTNEAIEPISNIFHENGASGVVIEDPLDLILERHPKYGEIFALDPEDYPDEGVDIKAYFPMNSSISETVAEIKQEIDQLENYGINLGQNKIMLTEVDEADWSEAWKKYYKPVHITDRITVAPSWENYQPTLKDELIIELDPGMAFGTGTHPTTILSIKALEKHLKPGDKVIDVGSGSGVLSIAAALLGAGEVHAFDLDEVAVKSTFENVRFNHVQHTVTVKQNDLLQNVDMEADVIVSNILAEIIVQFVADARNNLKHGGYFITSGIIQAKKQLVLDELEKNHFQVVGMNEMDDWVAIIAKKGG